ncbi:unnamed protein product [Rhizoctonia solani]|uniref:Transmembrane protein n=1 Tax=Rhizoctonia solani TaxID=456999 RepID=A0A8H3HSG5_9AGAM|nr:unnamed protein product [Rhizoctonia solani]
MYSPITQSLIMNTYSKTLIVGLTLVLANIPVVDARSCYYDRFGRYRCRGGLSRAARIGLGIGIAAAVLLLLALLSCLMLIRRRRARRAQGGYIKTTGPLHHDKPPQQPGLHQPYPEGGSYNPNQNGHAYGTPNYHVNEPQFPAPSYQAGGYAPHNGPPPTNYAPPPGPPPAK